MSRGRAPAGTLGKRRREEGWRSESVRWKGFRFGGRVFFTDGTPVCLGRLDSREGLATVSLRLRGGVGAEVLGMATSFRGLALGRLDLEEVILGWNAASAAVRAKGRFDCIARRFRCCDFEGEIDGSVAWVFGEIVRLSVKSVVNCCWRISSIF